MTGERKRLTFNLRTWDEDFSVLLPDFLAELNALAESVPEEHRDSVTVNFEREYGDRDYGECGGELSLDWARDETLAEMLAREARSTKDALERRAAEHRRRLYLVAQEARALGLKIDGLPENLSDPNESVRSLVEAMLRAGARANSP